MGITETLQSARQLIERQFSSSAKTEPKDTDLEKPEAEKTDEKVEGGAEWVKLNATIAEDNVHKENVERAAKLVLEKHKAEVSLAKQKAAAKIKEINLAQNTFNLDAQSKAILEIQKDMGAAQDSEVGQVVAKTVADALVANMIKTTLDVNPPETPEEINEYNKVVNMIKPLTEDGEVEAYLEFKEQGFKEKTKKPEPAADKNTELLVEIRDSLKELNESGSATAYAQIADTFNEILANAKTNTDSKRDTEPTQEPEVATNKPRQRENEDEEIEWDGLMSKREKLRKIIDTPMSFEDKSKAQDRLDETEKELSRQWREANAELEQTSAKINLKVEAAQAMSMGTKAYEEDLDSGFYSPSNPLMPVMRDPIKEAAKYMDELNKNIQDASDVSPKTKKIATAWITNVKTKWDIDKDRAMSRRTDVGQEDGQQFESRYQKKEKAFEAQDWGERRDITETAIKTLVDTSLDRDSKTEGTEFKKALDNEAKRLEAQNKAQTDLLKSMKGSSGMGMGMGMGGIGMEGYLEQASWMQRLTLTDEDIEIIKNSTNDDEIRGVIKRQVQRIEIDDDLLNNPDNLRLLLYYMEKTKSLINHRKPELAKEVLDFATDRIYFMQIMSKFNTLSQTELSEQGLAAFNDEVMANLSGDNGDRMGRLYGATMPYRLVMDDPEMWDKNNQYGLFNVASADGKLGDFQKYFQIIAQRVNGVPKEEWVLTNNPDDLSPQLKEWVGEAKLAFRMQGFTMKRFIDDASYGKGTNLGPKYNGKNFQALFDCSFWFKRPGIGYNKELQAAAQVEMYGFDRFLVTKMREDLAKAEIKRRVLKIEESGRDVSDSEKEKIEAKVKLKYSDKNIGINRTGRVINLVSVEKLAQEYKEKIYHDEDMTTQRLYERIFSDHDQLANDYFGKYKDAHATRTKLLGILLASPQDKIKAAGDLFKLWLHRAGETLEEGSAVEENGLGITFFNTDYVTAEQVKKFGDLTRNEIAATRMFLAVFEDAAASGIDPMTLRHLAERALVEGVGVGRRDDILRLLDMNLFVHKKKSLDFEPVSVLISKRKKTGGKIGGLFWAIVSSLVKVGANIK